jgi:hypothetical protein
VDFTDADRTLHADRMPTFVVIALYLSIVMVLGILVYWEFKRAIKRRQVKFPFDI